MLTWSNCNCLNISGQPFRFMWELKFRHQKSIVNIYKGCQPLAWFSYHATPEYHPSRGILLFKRTFRNTTTGSNSDFSIPGSIAAWSCRLQLWFYKQHKVDPYATSYGKNILFNLIFAKFCYWINLITINLPIPMFHYFAIRFKTLTS